MKTFKDKITLNKNSRGCYILDTIKGCSILKTKKRGCYDDCYAQYIASRYGFDFSKIAKRNFYRREDHGQLYLFDFKDTKHEHKIIEEIKNTDLPFLRIGEMGDPSEDWEHTINICNIITKAKKPIVIITKHLKIIPDHLLEDIKKLNLYINTSISALDDDDEIENRLYQYKRLKKYCNSVLRIVSCDFNKENHEGNLRAKMQDELFKNHNIIDTVFRPNLKNQLVKNKIINIVKVKFLKSKVIASVCNKNAYFGNCDNCFELCGIGLF